MSPAMMASSAIRLYGPTIAVGAGGMIFAWLSRETSGLLAVLMAVYICRDRVSTIFSIGLCGLALVLFFLLPEADLPPDVRLYLRYATFATAVIAMGLLIREKDRPKTIQGALGHGASVDDPDETGGLLSSSDAQLRQLIDAVPALVWSTTPEGEPCYFNRCMLDYTGITLDAYGGAVGRIPKSLAMQTLVHPDDLADQERLCSHSYKEGVPIRTKYRLRRADGVYRWVDARADPFRNAEGLIVQWYGVCVDIDDAQKAEAALRNSERQFRELVDTIPALVWCASPSGAPNYFNKRLANFTGVELGGADLSADEDRPSPTMRAVYHPDEIDELRRRWFECVRTGPTVCTVGSTRALSRCTIATGESFGGTACLST